MKKLQSRQARLSSLPAIAIGFAAVAVMAGVLFSSCDLFTYKRPFADAYYEDNFIANIGFDKFVGDSTTVPTAEVTGSWDFAYRYDEDGWSADPVQYMSLAHAAPIGDPKRIASGYGSADGLSPNAEVYRLEMANLITDGDFEGSAGTWATEPATGSLASTSYPSSSPINNKSMYLSLYNDSNYLTYTPTISSAQVIAGKKYQLDFKWSSSEGAPTGNEIVMNSKLITFNTGTARADGFTAEVSNIVTFKTPDQWSCNIDDVTVRKVGGQRLRLLLKKNETTPSLEDFLYKFTFWVHPDNLANPNKSPYHLDQFDATMRSVDNASSFSTNSDGGKYSYSASATGWQKMTVYIDKGNLQIVPGATGAVMELGIELDSALPGRILIAQPELRAYPDGY